MVFPFPAPVLGASKAPVIPIVDDFEGTWSPNASNGKPPNWSWTGDVAPGGQTRITDRPFSGTYSLRVVAQYDGDSWYLNATWSRTFTLAGHNRLKIRRARAVSGNNNITSDETFRLNGNDVTSGLILSTTDTGVHGPHSTGATYTWREYVVDISAYANGSLTLSIVAPANPNYWPFVDKLEFYGE